MQKIINISIKFALSVLICLSSSYADFPTARVVNGSNASQGEYPFAAFVEFTCTGYGSWFCGGSYIGGQMILTAGHCVVDLSSCNNGWSATVTLNRANLNSSNGQQINVKLAYLHPEYNGSGAPTNDIAALELVSTPTGVAPLSVVSSSQSSFYNAGTNTIIMGWGDTVQREDNNDGGSAITSDILQEAVVPVKSNATCSADYGSSFSSSSMFCAGIYDNGSGNVGVDTCQGDSGGPIVVNSSGTLKQIGIVSWGNGCASSQYTGVYTKLINYLDYVSALLSADSDDVAPTAKVNSGRCTGSTCKGKFTCDDPAPSVGIKTATAKLISRDGGKNYKMKVSTDDNVTFRARKLKVKSGRYYLKVKCEDYKYLSDTARKKVKVQ